jgi:hypothetical protein
MERALKFAERRRRFLNSDEGVRAASKSFDDLEVEFNRLLQEIAESGSSTKFEKKRSGRKIVLLGENMGFSLDWRLQYGNSLENSELVFVVYDTHPPYPGIMTIMTFQEPKQLLTLSFTFDINLSEEHIWVEKKRDGKQYSTKDIASHLLKRFMDEIIRYKK